MLSYLHMKTALWLCELIKLNSKNYGFCSERYFIRLFYQTIKLLIMQLSAKISSLSPAEFLTNFNEMAQSFSKTQSKFLSQTPSSQLTHFKKFPIPSYYHQMEGLNINTKQKEEQQIIAKSNRFNKLDEQFMRKHNITMRKTLSKMIQNNVKHMKTLEKSKAFYQMRAEQQKKSFNKTMSHRSFGAFKKKIQTKQNEDREAKAYPQINWKQVDRKRVKSAYTICFNPNYDYSKSKSKPVLKYKSQSQISKSLDKRPKFSKSSSLTQIQKVQQPIVKKSIASLVSSVQQQQMVFKQLPKYSKQIQINHFLNPSSYIKERFSQNLETLKYEYDDKIKKEVQDLRRQLIYHYANDQKEMR